MLVAVDDIEGARAAVDALLVDPDPVVRRQATGAAWDLNATETLPVLRARLPAETDDLARRTLAEAMVALTADDQVPGLLTALPPDLRTHVWWVLDRRWTPAQQLHRLADFSPGDDDWFAEWLGGLLRDPRARDWGEAELRLLVRLMLIHELHELVDNQVVLALAADHPEAVWAEGLEHAHALHDLISLHTLAKLDDDVVTRLAAAATNPTARGTAAAYLAWRNQPPPPPPTPPPPPPSRPTVADLVDADDLARLFGRAPDPAELARLDPDRRARLATRLTAALDEWLAAPEPPAEARWQAAPERLMPPATVWRMTWWAALDLPVDAAAWARLARQPLYAAGVGEWLTARFDSAFTDQLVGELPGWPRAALEHLVTLLPDPWPPKLAAALAEACWATGTDEPTRRRCAAQLAQSGQRDVAERLHGATGDPLLDEALVRLGDCDAEARLLDGLLAGGPTWPITTPSVDLRNHWLASLHCPDSSSQLVQALRALLLAGANSAELAPVFAALLAAAGPDALELVDQLAVDRAITEGPFLWYRRQELLDELLEQRARAARPDSFHELAVVVLDALAEGERLRR